MKRSPSFELSLARSATARRRVSVRRKAAVGDGGGRLHRRKAQGVAQRVRRRGVAPKFDVQRARQDAARRTSTRRRQPRGSEEARQQTKPSNPNASMNAAQRDERTSRLAGAPARAARHRDPGPREPLRDDAEERARSPAARAPSRGGYVELESAAFRDKTRGGDQARRAEEDERRRRAGQQQTQANQADAAS